jgi:hypothetical protein
MSAFIKLILLRRERKISIVCLYGGSAEVRKKCTRRGEHCHVSGERERLPILNS